MFRTTDRILGEEESNGRLIFELVVTIKRDKKIENMSCGWCEISISDLAKSGTRKLDIKGGTPDSAIDIKDEDIQNNRSGLNFLKKAINTGSKPKNLKIDIKTVSKLDKEIQDHLSLMPSTCLLHRPLLYFMSGYMNYRNDKLIKETDKSSKFIKPTGDVILSQINKIYDNPDIVKFMTEIWVEDAQPKIDKNKFDIEYIMTFSKDFISRLYSVLYTKEFR